MDRRLMGSRLSCLFFLDKSVHEELEVVRKGSFAEDARALDLSMGRQ